MSKYLGKVDLTNLAFSSDHYRNKSQTSDLDPNIPKNSRMAWIQNFSTNSKILVQKKMWGSTEFLWPLLFKTQSRKRLLIITLEPAHTPYAFPLLVKSSGLLHKPKSWCWNSESQRGRGTGQQLQRPAAAMMGKPESRTTAKVLWLRHA